MIRAKSRGDMIIDLTGPDGNAFSLLARASSTAEYLGWSYCKKQNLLDDMTSGDYENLITVFDKAFGDFIILER